VYNELSPLSASGAAHEKTASDKLPQCPREVLLYCLQQSFCSNEEDYGVE